MGSSHRKTPAFWENSDCLTCLSKLEDHFRRCGRAGDYRELLNEITAYWRTGRSYPRRMVFRCASLLQDVPELFQSLNTLFLAGDGDTEIFSRANGDEKGRLEIAMVASRGKGFLCCVPDDPQSDQPAFMSSEELISFLVSHTFFECTTYMTTVSKRWAPFVLELIQLAINETFTCQDEAMSFDLRGECIMYMRYLSWSHCVLPFTFYLPGVLRSGEYAVSGGGFSDIWKGRVGTRRVCIKVLRFFTQSSNREDIMNDLISEVLLLRQLRHPNILPFLGINDEVLSPSLAIITPWMPHGNLSVYLKHVPCSLGRKVKLLRQVVEGLRYLHTHSPPVVHCDIKAGNILVSEDEICCIGDFGLSILQKTSNEFSPPAVTDKADNDSGVRGSLRWLAPELLGPYALHSTSASSTRDVYALGCTILEVISGYPPFYDEKNEIMVILAVLEGRRPQSPPDKPVPNPILGLMEWCWEEDMDARPDAQNVLDTLDGWLKYSVPTARRGDSSQWDWLIEEEDDLDYDLPPLLDDEHQRNFNLESSALFDSLFDARELWGQETCSEETTANRIPRSQPPRLPRLDVTSQPSPSTTSSSAGSGLTSASESNSSAWWSDDDAPTTPHSSVDSIPIILSGYDFDTYRFAPESTLTTVSEHNINSGVSRLTEKARSEPVVKFRPPRGSVWHNRELQSAWNWYMDRRFMSGMV
ncbi:hypothetical protein E1B28_003420 [Marasmius oreades]|uniref:Protein kinase domain-containing protein n=1 Tax=Marasmius oreades TaxID=181124 RepID=A0A9P7RLG3_9AGAR|nr:uncharacterized protein E1B28_003420 [Marasmius oreades]KAG7085886.1 hypothetical protein E1B28_003420 [Marasmius oreades]